MTKPNPTPSVDLSSLMASEFHELKNQLGYLTLALGEAVSDHPDAAPWLLEPRRICQNISDRLVQALTLYKSDQGRLELNVDAQSPAAFLEEIRAQSEALAGSKIRIECHSEGSPPFWFFDRYLIELALLNAIHNALQFARERIRIGGHMADGGLCFEVRDDSGGYPAHILANQGRDPGRTATGTGLGLFFSHTIAQAHESKGQRGHLALSNDGGAVYRLWIP